MRSASALATIAYAFAAAELPGQLTPDRVDVRAVGLRSTPEGRKVVADERDALRPPERPVWRLAEQLLELLRELAERRPDARCHSASIEWVLPPPKLVCRLITGEAFSSPESRRTARPIRSLRPSVR